jgi:hypothetical protein
MPWKRHRLNLVREEESTGRTHEILTEIRQALGLPYVSTLFQALASFPQFFDLFWKSAKPVVSTQEFFLCSERLGAEAYTRVHNYFSVPSLPAQNEPGPPAQNGLQQTIDFYQYSSPMLLLLAAALLQEFETPGLPKQPSTPVASHPNFSRMQFLADEGAAPAASQKILDDIKRTLDVPFLSTCYVNLGQWPDFLKGYWESLKPMLRTALYEQHRLALRDSALAIAAELPEPLQLPVTEMEAAGVDLNDVHSVVQLTELFLDVLSGQVINMAFAKIGLEDGQSEQKAA